MILSYIRLISYFDISSGVTFIWQNNGNKIQNRFIMLRTHFGTDQPSRSKLLN